MSKLFLQSFDEDYKAHPLSADEDVTKFLKDLQPGEQAQFDIAMSIVDFVLGCEDYSTVNVESYLNSKYNRVGELNDYA